MALTLPVKQIESDGVKEFFDLYFSYVGESEAPKIFHRWSIIGGLSALLAKNVYYKFGHSSIYPNLYILLIGEPASRKTSAIDITKGTIKSTGFSNLSAARTSPEQFIEDLEINGTRDGAGAAQIFILEDEFLNFIGSKNSNFQILLTKLFDNPTDYTHKYKNSTTVTVHQPSVQVLGGMTYATFAEAFSPEILHTGFLSRLLLVFSEKTKKKIAFPEAPNEEIGVALVDKLQEIRLFHQGEVGMTYAANRMIAEIYETFEELEDGRLTHYCSRRHMMLFKLCIIMAAIERKFTITEHHVIWANTLLVSIEDRFSKALGEFGKAKNADIASKVMTRLYETDRPLSAEELWKVVVSDLDSIVELGKILNGLRVAGRILYVDEGYLPKAKVVKRLPYVDVSLLHPSEIPVAYLGAQHA